MLLSQANEKINAHLPMIKTMVALCPLLGLLGTVTGMIEVFNIMAVTGGGDAKSMAGGVSKATIPTMAGMVAAWNANAASSGLVWDLTIAAIALTVFVIAEVSVRRNWVALWAIPATFCIGVSCGLPLYLFLRSRPVR